MTQQTQKMTPEKSAAETERLNVKLKASGLHVRVTGVWGLSRVLDGWEGMMLKVQEFTPGLVGPVAHCIDLRYPDQQHVLGYATWSIPADGYEVVA